MGDGQRRLASRQVTLLNNGERVYRRPPLGPERTRIWRVTSYVGVRQEIASSIILIDDNQVLPRGPDGYHHTTHHRSRCSLAGGRLVRSRSLVLSRSSRAGTPLSWTDRISRSDPFEAHRDRIAALWVSEFLLLRSRASLAPRVFQQRSSELLVLNL